MHAIIHVRMYLCMSMYVSNYLCMYVCMHACMYACKYACIDVCMYLCMHVCMHASMHACMHAGMYVCMHACTYVCMHACMYACMYNACMHVCKSYYILVRWSNHDYEPLASACQLAVTCQPLKPGILMRMISGACNVLNIHICRGVCLLNELSNKLINLQIYIYIYCIHTHIHIYIYIYVYTHTNIYNWICICTNRTSTSGLKQARANKGDTATEPANITSKWQFSMIAKIGETTHSHIASANCPQQQSIEVRFRELIPNHDACCCSIQIRQINLQLSQEHHLVSPKKTAARFLVAGFPYYGLVIIPNDPSSIPNHNHSTKPFSIAI